MSMRIDFVDPDIAGNGFSYDEQNVGIDRIENGSCHERGFFLSKKAFGL